MKRGEAPAVPEAEVLAHVARVATLRRLATRAEQEAVVHEALIALASHADLLAAVVGHRTDPAALTRLLDEDADPASPTTLGLPDGVTVELEGREEDDHPERCTGLLRCGGWRVRVGWDPSTGFFARPDTRHLRPEVTLVHYVAVSNPDAAATSDG